MIETIFDLAKVLGHVDAPREGLLRTLCQAALDQLTGMLKSGLTPADCAPAFSVSCAFLALSALEQSGDGVVRFSAGDLTIEGDPHRGDALRTQALRMAEPYLADRDFSFVGVKG
ncbi:MAG: hypothetical protein RSC08_00815 [Oscillospiraceae bacterium]